MIASSSTDRQTTSNASGYMNLVSQVQLSGKYFYIIALINGMNSQQYDLIINVQKNDNQQDDISVEHTYILMKFIQNE